MSSNVGSKCLIKLVKQLLGEFAFKQVILGIELASLVVVMVVVAKMGQSLDALATNTK